MTSDKLSKLRKETKETLAQSARESVEKAAEQAARDSLAVPMARREEVRRRGISAAPGIVIGRGFLKDSEFFHVPRTVIDEERIEAEVDVFEQTLIDTRKEIDEIKTHMEEQLGEDHARIFDAHLLILDDEVITDGTIAVIREQRLNAAAAFDTVITRITAMFAEMEDEYLKDRYIDIKDVERRVIRNLLGKKRSSVQKPREPASIVAHDLSPSDTAQFDRSLTLAFATDLGGRTSHTAILARSQGVPAVVGLENLFELVENGDTVIVDGNTGTVVVNPTQSTIEEYEEEIARFKELEEQLLTLTGFPAVTLDDKRYGLVANLDLPEEVEHALDYGAQGVGLFRTEYFFISRQYLPSEEDQYQMYRAVAERMGDRPVVIRTLDIGGDKIASYLHRSPELNPFMGWRGIRFCLTRKDIFKTQLRAIYRASVHGRIRIMFPMISRLEEVLQAKEICAEVRRELARDRFKFDENVELGIMVETPAAVAVADTLAKHVSFFSIGTNDLVQYTMAVDRGNARIAHLYQNHHPAIIRFLRQTITAGHKRGIHVSVCGEMGGDPASVLLLIGMQVDEISLSPNMIPEVKRTIRSVTFDQCRALVRRVMRLGTTAEIDAEIEEFIARHVRNSHDNGGSTK
ncbi:MAG: phosphoenolpyruvate--protein phosphotransferase [Deltaproteobacteria bacterium]|nr:phosphoenolpyruvate--protein phosphotransferase [Deltaproteobacteria bacterium]